MYVPEIETHDAHTLEEAGSLLKEYAHDVQIIAGGTDVLVDLKTNRVRPSHLVTLDHVPGLQDIEQTSEGLRIGAMVSINALNRSPVILEQYPAIHDASSQIAAYQIRNRATIGGNVAGAVPCADLPPILIPMGAQITLWSVSQGERTTPLRAFLKGPRQADMTAEELVTSIFIPLPGPMSGACFERFTLREGNALAVASAGCNLTLKSDGTVERICVALGAVGPIPIVVTEIESLLVGKKLNETVLEQAGDAASRAAMPISDIRGSIAYRRKLAGILTQRAIEGATQRAHGQPKQVYA